MTGDTAWLLLAPMVAQGRTVGLLMIAKSSERPQFTDRDLWVARLFAALTALAIVHHRTHTAASRIDLIEVQHRNAGELADAAIQRLYEGWPEPGGGPGTDPRIESAPPDGGPSTGLDQAVGQLRSFMCELSSAIHAGSELASALHKLAGDVADRSHVTIEVAVDEDLAARLADCGAELVEIAREGLSEVVQHPSVSACQLSLRPDAGLASLELADDGRGFGVAAESLSRIRERASALGAEVEVQAVPEEGTSVTVTLMP